MRENLEPLVKRLSENFSLRALSEFLIAKNHDFLIYEPPEEIFISDLEKFRNRFSEVYKVGEIKLKDNRDLLVFGIKTNEELTERSSKKAQFELGKYLLNLNYPDLGYPDCGVFVFYDDIGNFRFSFIHKIYLGTKAKFSYYRRYTYYVEKGKPYRTFLKALLDVSFDSLENILKAFQTQPLTKEFYTEIQNWFAWALKEAKFPGGRLEENLIRLLTRLIFVWFLKEKKLIPEEIFNEEFLKGVVKDFGEKDYYYNVILQNLFFATLNRYPNERKFATHGDFFENRKEFGVKTLYRYKDKILISEGEFIKLFEKVPFINGGLFECLDEDKYINGFSRKEKNRAKLPDYLFFSLEREEDLTHFYGEKKKAKVRGLINILKDYNFTADESSPVDIEVSLDPELLGHIFENLLASYNPETQTTARKATGSYYTPKEIVDFMVEESLIEYFKTSTNIPEETLRSLLSYSEEEVSLKEEEKKELINAIDNLKVLDPAVGSGAFPVGVLHKLVHILSKIDPDNKLWYELQFNKALHEVENVLKIEDREKREELLKEVNDAFDESIKYPDYARKLYIIENSIYGVDIQPIAIQISKLRFFLSLLIDQKVDFSKENFGIKPLPHLETKFVSANSLIGLKKGQLSLQAIEIEKIKEKLKELYKKHFSIKTRTEKKRIEDKAKALKEQLRKLLESNRWPDEEIDKIVSFDIFSQTATANWFDPEWMFGVDEGFDIVIGNPPYGAKYSDKEKQYFIRYYKSAKTISGKQKGSLDTFSLFIERGFNILKRNGILIYIVPIAITSSDSMTALHNLLEENCREIRISSFAVRPQPIFENSVVNTSILFFVKTLSPVEKILCTKMYRKGKGFNLELLLKNLQFIDVKKYKLRGRYPKISLPIETQILDKLFSIRTKVKDLMKDKGKAIYYRTTGGRYFKIITPYPTGSTKEKPIFFDTKIAKAIGAILSSSLFFWWYQIYSNNLDLKTYEIESFPIPLDKLTDDKIKKLENLYEAYLKDIERNARVRKTTRYTNINSFKEYKIGKSKSFIDAIDDFIGPLYNLTKDEIEFIKNYEIEFRLSEDEDEEDD